MNETPAICSNVDAPRRYYAERNKSDRERQTPYDSTYVRNIKRKTNEQTKLKRTHGHREPMGDREEGVGEMSKLGEGVKK